MKLEINFTKKILFILTVFVLILLVAYFNSSFIFMNPSHYFVELDNVQPKIINNCGSGEVIKAINGLTGETTCVSNIGPPGGAPPQPHLCYQTGRLYSPGARTNYFCNGTHNIVSECQTGSSMTFLQGGTTTPCGLYCLGTTC
tara:strand:- start:750 stop:1178 length:429 start_codon:yes stop_codon:yes gene_type:complete